MLHFVWGHLSRKQTVMHLCLNGDACSPACAAAHSAVLRISLPLDFIICWLCWRWKDYDLTHHHQHLWYSAANTVQVAIVLLLHICPLVLAVANIHRVDVHTYNKKKDAETLGPEEGEVKKWHSEENYTVKYVSFVAYRASAEKQFNPVRKFQMILGKTVRFPKLSYWYHWKADVKIDNLEKWKLPNSILILLNLGLKILSLLAWKTLNCHLRGFQAK